MEVEIVFAVLVAHCVLDVVIEEQKILPLSLTLLSSFRF